MLALRPLLILLICVSTPALANSVDPFELSLEELLHVEVVSAAMRAQDQFTVPAAVHVISARDIERSGATSVGEALRGVPGLVVARMNNNSWAISARGLNGAFSNKQLVLVDGRTVYDPSFAGVYWDNLELPMADIERIEVIRGPSSAIWGANAVNGVINIITRHSRETTGARLTASTAGHHRIVDARYGDTAGEHSHFRVYGKYAERELFAAKGQPNSERTNRSVLGGFRWDSQLTGTQTLQLSGSFLERDLESYQETLDPLTFAPTVAGSEGNANTANLMARWQYRPSERRQHQLQFFSNHFDSDSATPLSVDYDTYRVSYQQSHTLAGNQLVVWGLEYQHLRYRSDGIPQLRFTPDRGREDDVAVFAHTEKAFEPLNLVLNVGVRLEDNTRGGEAVQPRVSLGWTPRDTVFVWGALSRATRKPSISDESIAALGFPVPERIDELSPVPFAGSLIGELRGRAGIDNETVDALDLGLRWQPDSRWSADLTGFYNRYHDFILADLSDLRCASGASIFVDPACFVTSPFVVLSTTNSNRGEARSHGAELASRWLAGESLSLELSYSYLNLDVEGSTAFTDFSASLLGGSSPQHQAALRWHYSPWPRWRIDGQVRHVSRLANPATDAHTTFDLRLSWEPRPGLTLALLGQELGDRRHFELDDSFDNAPATEVRRSVALQLRYRR
jgi:iron complex outermembrane receptor protein